MASATPLPGGVQEHRDLLEAYLAQANAVARRLLAALSTGLGLGPAERLEAAHRTSEASNSVLVLLRYPHAAATAGGHNQHTDVGSITLLFADRWGLQVMPASGPRRWQLVAPRRGCAVVNVGDSLRFLSRGRLRACLHRVVAMGDEGDRHAVAYFLRPDDGVRFVDCEGAVTTAQRWHDAKYAVFGADHAEQRRGRVLTGGREPAGPDAEGEGGGG